MTCLCPPPPQINVVLSTLDLSGNHVGATYRRGLDGVMSAHATSVPFAAVIAKTVAEWMTLLAARLHPAAPELPMSPATFAPPGGRFIDKKTSEGALTSTTFVPTLKLGFGPPPPSFPGPPPLALHPSLALTTKAPPLPPTPGSPASVDSPSPRERRPSPSRPTRAPALTSYPEASFRHLKHKFVADVLDFVASARVVVWEHADTGGK